MVITLVGDNPLGSQEGHHTASHPPGPAAGSTNPLGGLPAARRLTLFSPQGLAVLILFCVLNEEVQEAWKLACLGKKGPSEEATRSTQVGRARAAPAGCLEVWEGGREGGKVIPWAASNRALCFSPCLNRAPTPTTTRRCSRRAASSASRWGPPPSPR